MRTISFIILGLVVYIHSMFSQQIAKGYVVEDLNRNGKKERNEKGIPGVGVSNGREVVYTNEKGFYQLPVSEDDIIFVIKPTGYQVPVNESNLPQFYYIHKPQGSPADFKYAGVAPTGKLPASVDFFLYPAAEPERFTALLFGDPQVYTLDEVDYLNRGIVAETTGIQHIPFGISMGDLVGNDLDLHPHYIDAIKKVGIPWYNVIGNHDLNFDAVTDSLSDETFERHFGPANYAFNYANAHFLILDDILYPDPRGKSQYWGGFREDQLLFIENDLKALDRNKLLILNFHIPLLNEKGSEPFSGDIRDRLFGLLKEFPNVLVISAHTHLQQHNFYTEKDGWQGIKPLHEFNIGTICGNWYRGRIEEDGTPRSTMYDGTPKGYAFLDVSGNQYSIRYKATGKPADYQMEIFHPKVIAPDVRTSAQITVNFFMGKAGDEVLYRVDNGKWKPMTWQPGFDPSYVKELFAWDLSDTPIAGRRPDNPRTCNHLWVAPIPYKLPEGEHRIEIKATDMFGNTFTTESRYRIEKP